MTSPVKVKLPLALSGKTPLRPRPVPARKRGVSRSSRTLGVECGGRVGAWRRNAPTRTAKSCGPDIPTLISNWRQFPLMTGARKPGPRGDHEGNRKTIAQGMPADFGVPVVTTLVCFLYLRTRLWVQRAPGIPCALLPGGRSFGQQPGHDSRRGKASCGRMAV